MIADPIIGVFLSIILTIITLFFGAIAKINVFSFDSQAKCITSLKTFVNTNSFYGKNFVIKESLYPLNDCCIIVKKEGKTVYYCVERVK